MKKPLTMVMAVVFLAATTGWAQTPRKHTRPPYSGPRAANSKKVLPLLVHSHPGPKPGFTKTGKASHVLVR